MAEAEKKPKVLVTRKIPEKGLSLLREKVNLEIWPHDDIPIPRKELLSRAPSLHGIIALPSDSIDGEFFQRASLLKIVSHYAVGYDNIDVAEATKHHVVVTNTPDVLTQATADIAFALILGAARRTGEAERFLRSGKWQSWGPELLLGREVYGSTLGIVGLGRIGRAVAKRARGFDMSLCHTGNTPRDDLETGSRWLPLEELFRTAHIVSLHCPLTEKTRHLVNRKTLGLMKPGAILINTGRGGLVDQEALYEALSEGKLAAAGLDVFDPEPLPATHPLLTLENLMALPHIGSASVTAREGMAVMAARNILAVLVEGTAPLSRVMPE